MSYSYGLLIALPIIGMLISQHTSDSIKNILWYAVAVIFMLTVGLRSQVGGDWNTYERFIAYAIDLPLDIALYISDPGYAALNWIGAHTFGNVYLVNLICAVLAILPLMAFCATRSNPWLSLTIAVPYLIVVVFMGYTRQSAAIGLCIAVLMMLEGRRIWAALVLIMLAGMFHRAAAGFLLPTLLLSAFPASSANLIRTMSAILLSAAYLTVLFSWPTAADISGKLTDYASDVGELQSEGALPRLVLTAAAGAAFLILVDRQRLMVPQNTIWVLCAVGSFVLLPLALVYSTFADRIGLFLIPLQLHVVSMVDATLQAGHRQSVFRIAIVALSGVMLLAWLTYSSYAQYWLPYDNVLFHMI